MLVVAIMFWLFSRLVESLFALRLSYSDCIPLPVIRGILSRGMCFSSCSFEGFFCHMLRLLFLQSNCTISYLMKDGILLLSASCRIGRGYLGPLWVWIWDWFFWTFQSTFPHQLQCSLGCCGGISCFFGWVSWYYTGLYRFVSFLQSLSGVVSYGF